MFSYSYTHILQSVTLAGDSNKLPIVMKPQVSGSLLYAFIKPKTLRGVNINFLE
jgi:hypothetical protein